LFLRTRSAYTAKLISKIPYFECLCGKSGSLRAMAMANFEYELEIPSRLRMDKEAIPGTRRWCDEHKRGA